MKKHEVKNLTDLFRSLGETRTEVYNKEIEVEQAESMNNSAGKMIKIAALQASILTPEEAKEMELLK